jgi:PAS domain-containing protein
MTGDEREDGERDRWLTRVWVLTLSGFMLVVAGPWFVRATSQNVTPVAVLTFVWTLTYVILVQQLPRLPTLRIRGTAASILHVTALVVLALLWHLAGGTHNPVLLLAFQLPLAVGAFFLTGRAAFWSVAIASISVSVVALAESADFRRSIFMLGLPLDPLGALVSPSLQGEVDPFPRLVLTAPFLGLLVFAFGLFSATLVFVSRRAAAAKSREVRRAAWSDRSESRLEGLFESMLASAPTPSVVAYAESGRVVLASRTFVNRMLGQTASSEGRDLFDWLRFDDPDSVRSLLIRGGEIPSCGYRIGPEHRRARVMILPFTRDNERYSHISVADRDEALDLNDAWRFSPEPLIVLGAEHRICFANAAAEGLFGELYAGLPVEEALERSDLPSRWWSAGGSAQAPSVEVRGQRYRVRQTAVLPPGGSELRLVRLEREAS